MGSHPPSSSPLLDSLPAYLRQTPYARLLLRTPEAKRAPLLLPTEWSKKESTDTIALTVNNLQANYTGQGIRDSDAVSIRSNRPIPTQCGVYYYEVTIVNKGYDGFIGIGFSHGSVSTARLPGWEANSWGYHGDDGNCFSGSGSGRPYGPTFTSDDTIGCCINLFNHKVFFTKNGVRLYTAFHGVKGTLYPTVGMRTRDEKVLANFGARPFKFDIEQYFLDEKQRLWASIKSIPPPLDITNDLVLSYFIHHGYRHTARAFAQNVLGAPSHQPAPATTPAPLTRILVDLNEQDAEIKVRQRIAQLVLVGNIDGAIYLTQKHYPNVLANNEKVYFQLRCQKFIELIKRAGGPAGVDMLEDEGELDLDSESNGTNGLNGQSHPDGMDLADPRTPAQVLKEALRCGRRLQLDYGHDTRRQIHQTLVGVLSLLAYADPAHSPVATYLNESRRGQLAHTLNEEILVSQNKPRVPPLEVAIAQSQTVLDELLAQGSAPANLIQIERDLLA
ncbi:concanavalin A-like lectin/glucanase domain-containing protein [Dimargaris cristalligena]|uniref:Concanavalin A-like lectin/glucanase domain-containing protein n=1 Tax=Dimargaris cristalligena TaxID=215637 RepID=A0A4Q0A1S6_9FUNG|nr:concanavalin A-like lectin/glucanase domain-containing protein [Dimargaris cristalligena]|eukprot:RKP39421.1 concanavalin A-like lectin/glucanase domain-containing protein [Dimargaris cristalligena]